MEITEEEEKVLSSDSIDFIKKEQKRDFQRKAWSMEEIDVRSISCLFSSYLSNSDSVKSIFSGVGVTLDSFMRAEGGSDEFKKRLKNHLETQKKYYHIDEVIDPIGITILYVPPLNLMHEIDLDNLMKKIDPLLKSIYAPPCRIDEQNPQRIAPNEISKYQVITLPRFSDSPAEGEINIRINRSGFTDVFFAIRTCVSDWSENLDT